MRPSVGITKRKLTELMARMPKPHDMTRNMMGFTTGAMASRISAMPRAVCGRRKNTIVPFSSASGPLMMKAWIASMVARLRLRTVAKEAASWGISRLMVWIPLRAERAAPTGFKRAGIALSSAMLLLLTAWR